MRRIAVAIVALVALVHGCALVAGIQLPDSDPSLRHCVDGTKDDGETNIDCGGDCLACGDAGCTASSECQSGTCTSGVCAVPTCSNGVFDGYESSLDCGDPRGAAVGCLGCQDGLHCYNGCNCASSFCDLSTNTCAEGTPNCDTCADGVQDNTESDIDCGGTGMPMCPRCVSGQTCTMGSDCVSGTCNGTTCT